MKKILAVLSLCCVSGIFSLQVSAATPPSALTLEDAVDRALKNNTDVALAELNLETFHYYFVSALGGAVPDVILSGSYANNIKKQSFFMGGTMIESGNDHATNASLTVQQSIYSGGRVSASLHGGRAQMEAGRQDLAGAKDSVTLAVKKLFYAVLLSSETISIQRDNLKSAEDHLDTIKKRYRQGLDSDFSVLRQEVEVASAKSSYIRAKNLYEISLTLLKDTLAMDVDLPVRISGSLPSPSRTLPSYKKLAALAMEKRPDLLAARKRTEVARDLYRIASAGMKPQIVAYLTGQWSAQSADLSPKGNEQARSAAFGLKLDYPIFTGGEVWGKAKVAQKEYEKVKEIEGKTERWVHVEVKQQWLNLQEADERNRADEVGVKQARRAVEIVEARYAAGEASQLEMNDATVALNRARTLYAQSAHDYWISLASLEKAIGTPLQEQEKKP